LKNQHQTLELEVTQDEDGFPSPFIHPVSEPTHKRWWMVSKLFQYSNDETQARPQIRERWIPL